VSFYVFTIVIFHILTACKWNFVGKVNDKKLLSGFPVYCGLIALVFSMYLVYDTQRLMGGKKYSLSPEEHVYAGESLLPLNL